jgi:excisionase family DNA binding protein
MALRGRRVQKEETDHQEKSIEINAQMQGSLTFKDPINLRINGDFHGDLETRGTLSIGNKSRVEANIVGDNIIIAGKVTGDITAKKMLVLMPTAVLYGNVTVQKLNIVEGAVFQGYCQMMEEAQPDGLMSIDEVARYLEIETREIDQLANSGKIPGTRVGNAWKFERAKIDQWAASVKVK